MTPRARRQLCDVLFNVDLLTNRNGDDGPGLLRTCARHGVPQSVFPERQFLDGLNRGFAVLPAKAGDGQRHLPSIRPSRKRGIGWR
jgi:hypothetical protein